MNVNIVVYDVFALTVLIYLAPVFSRAYGSFMDVLVTNPAALLSIQPSVFVLNGVELLCVGILTYVTLKVHQNKSGINEQKIATLCIHAFFIVFEFIITQQSVSFHVDSEAIVLATALTLLLVPILILHIIFFVKTKSLWGKPRRD